MESLGRHILVDYHDCSRQILNNTTLIEEFMLEAARQASATIIQSHFHHFSPFGVSGVVIIQESHLTIHTWPESHYAAVDIFTCGAQMNPWKAHEYLMQALCAGHSDIKDISRGRRDNIIGKP
ncbi:MAG: adenosylmethionine decarboxylase [Bacteroidia bacterium]